MKRLWVAAAMAPLVFAAAAHAGPGPTTISGSSAPVTTLADGDLTIATTGSITPTATAAGAGVTINSGNMVTNNGTIAESTGLAGTVGILGVPPAGGFASTILNAGTISLTESDSFSDTNKDGLEDTNGSVVGQWASGQNRFGIEINGAGNLNGSITNSGSITVIGDSSAGILIASPLVGNLVSSGTITVTGGNYYDLNTPANRDQTATYGIRSTAQITGNVTLSGTITATGANVVGVSLEHGVAAGGGNAGSVELFGTISATGFRSTSSITSADAGIQSILYGATPSTATSTTAVSAGELMQGGPAMHISNGVAGGISIDAAVAAVAASGTTAAVTAEPAGVLYSYGTAPALQIDGSGTVGAYTGGKYGLVVGGTVAGYGIYPLVADTTSVGGLVAASAQGILVGGSTTIAGGVDITGVVNATSVSISTAVGAANATGLHFTGTSSTPTVDVGYGGLLESSSQATNAPAVTALKVDPTASVGAVVNDGTIYALIAGYNTTSGGLANAASGGVAGVATAIQDQHGVIASITNHGSISASFAPGVTGATIGGSAVAIDLSAGTVPVVVTQEQISLTNSASFNTANTAALANSGTALVAPTPSITGDILFGAGSATLNVQAGTITGGISFGAGANNILNIGTAGAGVENTATDPLEVKGALLNTGTLAVNVTTGTLYLTNNTGASVGGVLGTSATVTNPINLASLTVGQTGAIIFTANAATGNYDKFIVSGPVTLASGASVGIAVTGKLPGTETYQVITTSGTLTASNVNDALLGSIPYFYSGAVTTSVANGTVDVTLTPKTAAQAGLNPAESSAFNAIYANFDKQADTSTALLGKTDKASFVHLYDQFLPDYAGGPFETMMVGQQAIARAEAEGPIKLRDDESRGWVQEISYANNRTTSDTVNGYRGSGFGAAAGYEQANSDGAVGVAAAFMTNAVHDNVQVADASLSASVVEAGVYWRSTGPGLNASANLNAGWSFFQSHRYVIDQVNDATAATLIHSAKSNWSGGLVSGQIALNYPMTIGRFYLRPEVSADYTALYEGAHSETDGGTAVDLSVASKTSQEAAVQGDMVMGATFGDSVKWRPEMTLGWREIVAGGPASTTAHFAGGQSFTLSPQFTERGGLLARLGLRAGGAFADFSADAGGVFRSGYETYDARAMARFLF